MVAREMKSGKTDHGDGPATAGSKLDKKEVSVWKLQDNVSKLDFRHWLDAIDLQLEAIHGFSYPDLVLEKVKRYPTEITESALKEIIQTINDEQTAKKRKESGKEEPVIGSPGLGSFSTSVVTHGTVRYQSIRAAGTSKRNPDGCTLI